MEKMMEQYTPESNVKTSDRILVLKPKEGAVKNSMGVTDNRLFTGENQLHCYLEPNADLWAFKLEKGGLPGPLKQKFTKFSMALEHAKKYYASRNVEISQVID
jgi:hypothetical protein